MKNLGNESEVKVTLLRGLPRCKHQYGTYWVREKWKLEQSMNKIFMVRLFYILGAKIPSEQCSCSQEPVGNLKKTTAQHLNIPSVGTDANEVQQSKVRDFS